MVELDFRRRINRKLKEVKMMVMLEVEIKVMEVVRVEMEVMEKNKRGGGDDGVVMVVKTVL